MYVGGIEAVTDRLHEVRTFDVGLMLVYMVVVVVRRGYGMKTLMEIAEWAGSWRECNRWES